MVCTTWKCENAWDAGRWRSPSPHAGKYDSSVLPLWETIFDKSRAMFSACLYAICLRYCSVEYKVSLGVMCTLSSKCVVFCYRHFHSSTSTCEKVFIVIRNQPWSGTFLSFDFACGASNVWSVYIEFFRLASSRVWRLAGPQINGMCVWNTLRPRRSGRLPLANIC